MGLRSEIVDAGVVLDALRDHHCLIEQSGDDTSFRFQHQLINEWYASNEVRRMALRTLSDEEARRCLDREILDQRIWTEAIKFAVERPPRNDDDIAAISYLILRTIGIDPLFAADLIAIAPEAIWSGIAPTIRTFVEQLHSSSKEDAVEFVLHCGKDEFAEVVWEAIEAQQSEQIAQVLDRKDFLHPSVLGAAWKKRGAALTDGRREYFLVMLAASGSLEGAKMAVDIAKEDKSPEIQSRVAEMLDFYRFHDELNELLEVAPPEAWELIVRKGNIEGLWEAKWREFAIAALYRVFEKMPSGPQKIHYALRIRSLGEVAKIDLVAELLATEFDDHHNEYELYGRVAELEGERLSEAIVERLLRGDRVTYRASRYIKRDVEIDQDQLLMACRSEASQRRHDELSLLLSVESLNTFFSELLGARREWQSKSGKERQAIADRFRTLQDTLTHADKNSLAEMILGLTLSDSDEIGTASEVIMRGYRSDHVSDERPPLRPGLRDRLIGRLCEWSDKLLADKSCSRTALHDLAEAIATFPSEALLTPLRNLLSAELDRWRVEKEEFRRRMERGERPDSDSGARMSYAFRYGQNMLSLATGRDPDFADVGEEREQAPTSQEMTEAVIDILSDFLLDYEFGDEAARVIATLRLDPISAIGKARRIGRYDLYVVSERRRARRNRGIEPVDLVAKRLLDAIDELKQTNTPKSLKHAVKLCLSVVRMDCGEYIEPVSTLVIENGSLEDISHLLMLRLLFGHQLDSRIMVRCLDELDGRRSELKWEYDQSWYKWKDLLILLIFAGEPITAARRLLSYEPRGRDHDERQIIEAFGLCQHSDALDALSILRSRCIEQRIEHEWCTAIGKIDTPEAGEVLLSHLTDGSGAGGWNRVREVSETVAKLAQTHESVWLNILGILREGDVSKLGRIRDVIRHVNSEDMIIDLVSLPADRLNGLTGSIANALREVCIEYRQIPGQSGVRDVSPRPIARLRATLFAGIQANDGRSASCEKLLRTIDHWREGYGTPHEEGRHPDITVGAPWPQIAQSAWDTASTFLRETSR